MVFPLVMYGCDSWTIKKGERQRIDAFELWCCRRFLRVPCTTSISNQSVLNKINPNIHWKGWWCSWNSSTLATWSKNWLIGKDPDAGKDWRQKDKGTTEDKLVGWYYWLNGHEFEQALGDGEGQGGLAFCSPWGCKVGHSWPTEQQLQFPKRSSRCQPTTTFCCIFFFSEKCREERKRQE